MVNDTIAAIATAVNNSGISIIRVSGKDAVPLVDKIFRSVKGRSLLEAPSHTIHYGFIHNDNEDIDEVLVMLMKAPNTYTREDVVEIDCHGGIKVTGKILDLVVNSGARLAEPGEFTKRAFLNGRIDLSQAEAVMDIITAQNDYALSSSMAHLHGRLLQSVKEIREQILTDIAFIEAALDDPEHLSIDDNVDKLRENVDNYIKNVDKMCKSANNGRLIKEGINTVILGKPNVGKSSFLNYMAGDSVAIVTDVPGTTRDSIEQCISIGDISLNIIDTAGIRESGDEVERIGIARAFDKADAADLIIFIIDVSRELDENDHKIFDLIKDRKAVILLNKSDLTSVTDAKMVSLLSDKKIFEISVKNGWGINEFEDYIKTLFFEGELNFNDEIYITNARHKQALAETLNSLYRVAETMDSGMPEDFITIDLMSAYNSLGEISGDTTSEDLANKIFSTFCMGK